MADLARGEADIAIYAHNDPPEALFGKRLLPCFEVAYASSSYLDEWKTGKIDWCGIGRRPPWALRQIKARDRLVLHAALHKPRTEMEDPMADAIMIPVDLEHKDGLEKAIGIGLAMAKDSGGAATVVGVTGSQPGAAAHTPEEYAEKLAAYAMELSKEHGVVVTAKAVHDNDVAADLGTVLISVAEDIGADVIVMASHVPGFLEHFFASNAGYVAAHAKCSVYVVR